MYKNTYRLSRKYLSRLIYMDVLYAGFAGAKTGRNKSERLWSLV